MLSFTDTQKHLFKQVAFDGSNKTSEALSEMFDCPVQLIPVNQSLLLMSEVQPFFSSSKLTGATIAISQKIEGEFNGYSFLPISRQEAKHLVNLLSPETADHHHDALSHEERDILTELTNVIGGYLTGSISDLLGFKVSASGTPILRQIEFHSFQKIFEDIFDVSADKFLVFESKISVRLGETPFYSVLGFPAKSCEQFLERAEKYTGAAIAFKERKVLVVDDSNFLRKRMSNLLIQRGYMVDEAANGKEAIDKVKSTKYDMVFSDLLMPEVGGMEVLDFIKKTHPEIPVVIVTSKAQQSVIIEAMQAGVGGVIFKPLSERKLDELIEKLTTVKTTL